MILNCEKFYISLDAEARHVYHVLALCSCSVSVAELTQVVSVQRVLSKKRVREILEEGKRRQIISGDYYDSYLLNGYFAVWIFPLVEGYVNEKKLLSSLEKVRGGYYYGHSNKCLIAYLDALWKQPVSIQLKSCEEDLLRHSYQASYLMAIFDQPLYEKVLDRMSGKIMEMLYCKKAEETVRQLESCDILYRLDAKFADNKSLIAIE